MPSARTNSIAPGEPGLQPDGSYITPEGDRLASEADKATYLHTVQDWIVAPQIKTVDGVAGIDSLGGYEKEYLVVPDVQQLAALKLSLGDLASALERNNVATGGGTVNRNGEGLAVRADARIRSLAQLRGTVIATREGMPITLGQVAEVRLGQGVRMGAGSENGREVVTGTAIMRIGENSRTVSIRRRCQAQGDRALAAPRHRDRAGARPHQAGQRDHHDRRRGIWPKARCSSSIVLFLLLGNFRAALIAALVIPITMLLTGFGMLRIGVSANLMSLGALDFGLIVDGAVIIVENALRRIAERQHARGTDAGPAGAARDRRRRGTRDDPALGLWPGDHHPRLCAAAHLERGRGQDVRADGADRHHGARLRLRAVAHLRPRGDRHRAVAPGRGEGRPRHRLAAPALRAGSGPRHEAAEPDARRGDRRAGRWPAGAYTTLGQEFLPQLDEGDVLVSAFRVPGTSVEQSQKMQAQIEHALQGMPEIRTVFSRTGTAEVASDPMPPNATDTFIMLKDREGLAQSFRGQGGSGRADRGAARAGARPCL